MGSGLGSGEAGNSFEYDLQAYMPSGFGGYPCLKTMLLIDPMESPDLLVAYYAHVFSAHLNIHAYNVKG